MKYGSETSLEHRGLIVRTDSFLLAPMLRIRILLERTHDVSGHPHGYVPLLLVYLVCEPTCGSYAPRRLVWVCLDWDILLNYQNKNKKKNCLKYGIPIRVCCTQIKVRAFSCLLKEKIYERGETMQTKNLNMHSMWLLMWTGRKEFTLLRFIFALMVGDSYYVHAISKIFLQVEGFNTVLHVWMKKDRSKRFQI